MSVLAARTGHGLYSVFWGALFLTGNLEAPPGPEDSRATPLGGMDHGTVMARVHVEFGQVGKVG